MPDKVRHFATLSECAKCKYTITKHWCEYCLIAHQFGHSPKCMYYLPACQVIKEQTTRTPSE